MKIGVPKERVPQEKRVAVSPDSIKKLIALGFEVVVESGAGDGASFSDDVYKEAGASIARDAAGALSDVDIVFKVRPPSKDGGVDELSLLTSGTILVSSLGVMSNKTLADALARQGVTAFAMELLPRITRAQSMDILSSQSNLSGYKAVLDAAGELGRAFPMMMTAAATRPNTRFLCNVLTRFILSLRSAFWISIAADIRLVLTIGGEYTAIGNRGE